MSRGLSNAAMLQNKPIGGATLDIEGEKKAIKAVIKAESDAFFARDYDAWAQQWSQVEETVRLGAQSGGAVNYSVGWDKQKNMVSNILKRYPDANQDAVETMRRENWQFRISADMAFVTFDQNSALTKDTIVPVGLSHQMRLMEKINGVWKITMAAHADTSIEYFKCPVVRVSATAEIEWMNEPAKAALPESVVLCNSNGQLRAKHPEDDKLLRAKLTEYSKLTPMDLRLSLDPQVNSRATTPIILGQHSGEVPQIVWVSFLENMYLVSFQDIEENTRRLDVAAELFELSPAQIKLASALVNGLDLQGATEELGVSINTLRTQLQRIFDKTGTRTQAALISKLLTSATPAT